MNQPKPFAISKRSVWEAFKRVKANRGAAGVDGQSIEEFEQDLSGNLYKLWNRLSSGSYMPPAVRRVEIPKATGGTRPLGIPTVADRIAQMVVKDALEPILEPCYSAVWIILNGQDRSSALTLAGAASGILDTCMDAAGLPTFGPDDGTMG